MGTATSEPVRLPPGPRVPKIVQGIAYLTATATPGVFAALGRRYGTAMTVNLPIFGRAVVISDPFLVKDLFSTSTDLVERPTDFLAPGELFGPGSTFSLAGDEHLARRRLLAPSFHGKRMRSYEHIIEDEVMREIATWPEGREFETLQPMLRITLGAILRAVFGAEGPALNELRGLLPPMVALASRLYLMPPMGRRDLGRWSFGGRYLQYRRRFDAAIDSLIAEARADPALEERSDVLALLLQSRYENGEPICDRHIADELLTMVAAGHETTASALTWTVERLRRDPRLLSRLTEEVDTGGSELRQATIWEVLRSRPVIEGSVRRTKKRIRLGDWVIPENTAIIFSIRLAHLLEESFPDAASFNPDRFVGAKPEPFAWIPFGGGVNRCIGAAFANMEMDITLRTLLREFRFAPTDAPAERRHIRGLATAPGRGGRAVIYRRTAKASSAERIPFNRVDTLIYHFDQTPDLWSIHFEVRVGGLLDPSRLAAAALEAVRRHPMGRARMEPFGPTTRTFHWLIDDEVAAVPLEIVDCTTDAQVEAARVRLLSRRIDLKVAPPLALALAHHPEGDYLIMNLSHVVGDGMSAYRLMSSICRAYTGSEDTQPVLPLAHVRNLRGHVGYRNLADARTRLGALARHVSDTRNDAPVPLAVDGGSEGVQGLGFHLLRFDRDEAVRIAARRVKPATINDLLLAALAVTIRRFNDQRGVVPGRISLAMPVNLRPAEWSNELVSNIVSMVSVGVPKCAQSDLVAAQAAVAERTAELKEQRLPGAMVNMMGMFGIWPAGVRQAAVRWSRGRLVNSADTGVLSNLGNLPQPLDFGAGAGAATEVRVSPPAGMPPGTAMGALTMNGEMFLALRYCRAQFDDEGAAQFAADLRKVLLDEPSPGLPASADGGISHRMPG